MRASGSKAKAATTASHKATYAGVPEHGFRVHGAKAATMASHKATDAP